MRTRTALIFLLMFAGCATAPVQRPWKLELVTAGGIDGNANGVMTIDSSGMVRFRMATSLQRDLHADARQMWQYETLLAAAHPENWQPSYLAEARPGGRELYRNVDCCEPVEFHLTMTMDGKQFTTAWLEPKQPLPGDLTNLADQLVATIEAYSPYPVTTPRYRQVLRESF
jgi:hypothetical protein